MNRKRIVALVMVAALALTSVIGGTLAYFTDTDDATNTFTMGNVEIVLDEAPVEYNPDGYEWVEDKTASGRVDTNTYGDEDGYLYPGAVLPKDPTVHNTGLNDAYIRIKVTMNPVVLAALTEGEDGLTDPLDQFLAIANVDTTETCTWEYEDDVIEDGLWTLTARYSEIVAPGESTTPFFTTVTIPTSFENNEDLDDDNPFTMEIVAEAIQAASFEDADEAWAAFDAETELPAA